LVFSSGRLPALITLLIASFVFDFDQGQAVRRGQPADPPAILCLKSVD
jgi:hypothetical protein